MEAQQHYEPDRARIERVCRPCDLLQSPSLECVAVAHAGDRFSAVFEDRRCRPMDFMVRFLRRRLNRRGAPAADAEDIASEVVTRILKSPPAPPLPAPDLTGLYRFLSVRAIQADCDLRTKQEGRRRCGNCRYVQQLPGNQRRCQHPTPTHPWRGKAVTGSTEPHKLDPPCEFFFSRRSTDPLGPVETPGSASDSPEQSATLGQRYKILAQAITEVARKEPKIALVLYRVYFDNHDNPTIASELGMTTKTVTRYKQRGLEMLREFLEDLGLEDLP